MHISYLIGMCVWWYISISCYSSCVNKYEIYFGYVLVFVCVFDADTYRIYYIYLLFNIDLSIEVLS